MMYNWQVTLLRVIWCVHYLRVHLVEDSSMSRIIQAFVATQLTQVSTIRSFQVGIREFALVGSTSAHV